MTFGYEVIAAGKVASDKNRVIARQLTEHLPIVVAQISLLDKRPIVNNAFDVIKNRIG